MGFAAGVLDLADEFRALAVALQGESARYALCGGLALAAHGHPRATVDIDIWTSLDSLGSVIRVAQSLGFVIESRVKPLASGRILLFRLTKVDPSSGEHLCLDLLLPATPDQFPISVETMDFEGVSVPVVSRQSLIELKRLRDSAQDQVDISNLDAGAPSS